MPFVETKTVLAVEVLVCNDVVVCNVGGLKGKTSDSFVVVINSYAGVSSCSIKKFGRVVVDAMKLFGDIIGWVVISMACGS